MKQEVKSLKDLVPDLDFTDEDVISTFDKLDTEKEGLITYSQFLYASLEHDVKNDEDLLMHNFKELDSLNEGFLTRQSIGLAMQRKGFILRESTIIEALEERGLDMDAKIDFEMMKQLRTAAI